MPANPPRARPKGTMEDLVEQIMGSASGNAAAVILVLPVSYAFAAGMMATINPCGFALLPAYISLYLEGAADGRLEDKPLARLVKAVAISVVVTLGFVLLFGSVGLIIAAGGHFLTSIMPWAGLLIGIAMALLGLWLLAGGTKFYLGTAMRLSAKLNPGPSRGVSSFFIFGIAYGVASLSCTLPIFLIVVGSSLAAQGFLNGLFQFISFALGMGAVLMVLTLGTAFFKGVVASYLRGFIPYIERASAVLVLLAGTFIVYYWITIGELGESIQGLF